MEWWKDELVYQIYPRSFQDSNNDGIGDIPGIISRLDHIKELGAGAIWLSPVYPSPNDDNGYDISNYMDINPEYGTLADMDRLIAEAKDRGIRIIMDLVVNHTSTSHEWFEKSRQKIEPYTDYYYWAPAKPDGSKPNNWLSFFMEDCWEWDEVRGEYYLHLFAKSQADLNYHCPQVLEDVKKVLRFWLDRGVAGFRCDVINILWKDSLEDGKKQLGLVGMEHYHSLEGTHEILRQFRDILDEYGAFAVGECVMIDPQKARDLCGEDRHELSEVFSFEHMDCDCHIVKWFGTKFRPKKLFDILVKWQEELPWNTIFLENHDQPRSIFRFGSRKYWRQSGKLLGTLVLTMRGTPFIYQGQEIGMTGFDFTGLNQINDVESHNVDRMLKKMGFPESMRWQMIARSSRDNARTPMQWDDTAGAGFTNGRPWLGINRNHEDINLKAQEDDPNSIWNYYKALSALRRERPALRQGKFLCLEATNQVFVYRRSLGDESYTISLNFSDSPARVGKRGRLLSSNYDRDSFDGVLLPWEAVILEDERD